MTERFHRLSTWLRRRFGERVYKVSLRGGFTCPNRDGTLGREGCAFCAGEALEPVGFQPGQSVAAQLGAGMDYIRKRHGARRFIAYFQDYSATYAPVERLRAIYQPALDAPEVVAIAAGTRPDCVEEPVLEFLETLFARKDGWLELGLQVANDGLLAELGRGHSVADFTRAVTACHRRGLRICAHIIVGLPGATPADEHRTADLASALDLWGVKIHAFHVIRGTRMASRHAAGRAPVLDQAAYVDRVVAVLERLPPDMVIHRVTGEAPPRLTLAPAWTTNKLRVYDAVVDALRARDTWQGRLSGRRGHEAPP